MRLPPARRHRLPGPARLAAAATFLAIVPGLARADERPAAAPPAPEAEKAPRPHLVLIIADDLGWDDCGPYGNRAVRTPNLDRLAREGRRFDHAFVTISSCSPSRASLLTGRYPHRTDAEELHWPVPGEQVTFTESLRAAGYWTAAAGKWHLGEAMRDRFDEVREVDTSGFQLPAGATSANAAFRESAAGDARSGCAEWVPLLRARPRDRPCFLWLAAVDPHRPYDDGIVEPPHDPGEVAVPPYLPDTPEVRADLARYYDEITRLDRFVGAVLDELDAQGIADETLVLFISDNGRPFPRDKTTLYDSGIRTPWIIRWPERVKPGTSTAELVSTVDIAPTFLRLAGADPLPDGDGVDFSRLLDDGGGGGSRSVRPYVFAEKNWHDFEDHARAVRDQRFKLIRNGYPDLPLTPPADAVRSPTFEVMKRLRAEGRLSDAQARVFAAPRPAEELYDCANDPHELRNLAGDPALAAKLAELRAALDTWEHLTGDRVPALRTADEFDRETGAPTPARRRPRWPKARMVAEGLAAP